MKRLLTAILLVLPALILLRPDLCPARTEYSFSGQTMGTFYTVRYLAPGKEFPERRQKQVDMRLKAVNRIFSRFDPDSRLSDFNRQAVGTCIRAVPEFYQVMETARQVYLLSEGAWDGTVKPLVDLWGFGAGPDGWRVPAPEEIEKALARTGFGHIRFSADQTLCRDKDVTLDLGSIAKGHGVDAVAALFLSSGIRDVLVEIGGELAGFGTNRKGEPWRVGISRPEADSPGGDLIRIIRLNNRAIATSGTYRNFFEADGKTYSHIIDPGTGRPAENGIVSASVIAGNCALADGLATALMVMDPDKGLDMINRLENTECLILIRTGDGIRMRLSDHFDRYSEN